DLVLVCDAARIWSRLRVSIPILAEQRHLKARINQSADKREPIGVAAADEEHIAGAARRGIQGPWPMHVRVAGEWQIMNSANATTPEIFEVCVPRRKDGVVGRDRGKKPIRSMAWVPRIVA